MATNIIQQTAGRTGQGQSRVSQRAKRFFILGILGGSILLALALGLAVQQGADTQAQSAAPVAVAPSNPATGVSFRVSSPNELDTDTTGAIPANNAPVVYQVSFPNESNPDSTVSSSVILASSAPAVYRVSFPNESNSDGTISDGVTSTSYPSYPLSYPNEQHPETP
jgi:hypothetical protein